LGEEEVAPGSEDVLEAKSNDIEDLGHLRDWYGNRLWAEQIAYRLEYDLQATSNALEVLEEPSCLEHLKY
jgi:hypothetical protein